MMFHLYVRYNFYFLLLSVHVMYIYIATWISTQDGDVVMFCLRSDCFNCRHKVYDTVDPFYKNSFMMKWTITFKKITYMTRGIKSIRMNLIKIVLIASSARKKNDLCNKILEYHYKTFNFHNINKSIVALEKQIIEFLSSSMILF